MNHDEMVAVIQAAKKGKTIQLRSKNLPTGIWITTQEAQVLWALSDEPYFNFEAYDYRVKPEPEVLHCIFKGDIWWSNCQIEQAAKDFASRYPNYTYKKFVEVMD